MFKSNSLKYPRSLLYLKQCKFQLGGMIIFVCVTKSRQIAPRYQGWNNRIETRSVLSNMCMPDKVGVAKKQQWFIGKYQTLCISIPRQTRPLSASPDSLLYSRWLHTERSCTKKHFFEKENDSRTRVRLFLRLFHRFANDQKFPFLAMQSKLACVSFWFPRRELHLRQDVWFCSICPDLDVDFDGQESGHEGQNEIFVILLLTCWKGSELVAIRDPAHCPMGFERIVSCMRSEWPPSRKQHSESKGQQEVWFREFGWIQIYLYIYASQIYRFFVDQTLDILFKKVSWRFRPWCGNVKLSFPVLDCDGKDKCCQRINGQAKTSPLRQKQARGHIWAVSTVRFFLLNKMWSWQQQHQTNEFGSTIFGWTRQIVQWTEPKGKKTDDRVTNNAPQMENSNQNAWKSRCQWWCIVGIGLPTSR